MTGEFNIQKFLAFLKSFWGLLALFTAVFPTIIYFLNASQIKSSILNDYYLGIPTTFALLTIPFTFLFEDKLSSSKFVRKLSLIFSLIAFLFLFSFLIVKSLYISDKIYSIPRENGYGRIEIKEKQDGQIFKETFDSLNSNPIKEERAVNILEVISLVIYTISIVFLTASFSMLGVFFYIKSNSA